MENVYLVLNIVDIALNQSVLNVKKDSNFKQEGASISVLSDSLQEIIDAINALVNVKFVMMNPHVLHVIQDIM
jgi:hypothetical protein